jgi:hypothetical protein
MGRGNKNAYVSVFLTWQQIDKLDTSVALHPTITTRSGYLEAAIDGKVESIPYVQEVAGTSGRTVSFYLGHDYHSTIKAQVTSLGIPLSAPIREILFGVRAFKRKWSELHTHLRIFVRVEQRDALNSAVLAHPTIQTQGEYLLAALDGSVPRIECSMDPSKGSKTLLGPHIPTQRYLELCDEARRNNQTLSTFLHAQLFTQPRCAPTDTEPLLFIDLRLRDYENDAVRAMIAKHENIDSFGALVSALRAGDNIEVIQPVAPESWKDVNTRIYLRADELDDLRRDLDVSKDSITEYLTNLLFGNDYERVSNPRKPYKKRIKKVA